MTPHTPPPADADGELQTELTDIAAQLLKLPVGTNRPLMFDMDVLIEFIQADRAKAVLEALENVRHKVGWEEEPDFGPGDATYGDTEHDHNAVIYGRNEVKGFVQEVLENGIAPLKREQGPTNAK